MSAIIDTHIHLDSPEFQHDLSQVISESKQCGIHNFIIPAASIHTLEYAMQIANTYDEVYYASGIHPCHVDELINYTSQEYIYNKSVITKLTQSIESPKCKAIGECGLDFFRLSHNANKEIAAQIACFEMQINLALERQLPLILHVRDNKENNDASKKVAEILRKHQKHSLRENLRGVFHCYNASDVLLEFSDSFYYGIGGIVTFKNAKELTQILPKIPLDRILLETDAPYLTPVPHRGIRNESKFLPHIVSKISEILNISESHVCETTTHNAQSLFALP